MSDSDREHLSVAAIKGLDPKFSGPVIPQAILDKSRTPVPEGLIWTGFKSGFVYDDGDLHFYKFIRQGKKRHAEWIHLATRRSDARLLFRSKRALKNYQMVMPSVDPADFDLMDRAFNLHSRNTQDFRRDWKSRELKSRGTAHDHRTRWLPKLVEADEDCCLFFPGAKCGEPVKVKYNYANMSAARASLIRAEGLPPEEVMLVVHKCGMGHMSCCNPKHLAWGTASDNAKDRVIHSAHKFDPTECDEALAQEVRADRRLTKVIAWDLRIPVGMVSAIKMRRIYENLK